jgi:hypothetical protein
MRSLPTIPHQDIRALSVHPRRTGIELRNQPLDMITNGEGPLASLDRVTPHSLQREQTPFFARLHAQRAGDAAQCVFRRANSARLFHLYHSVLNPASDATSSRRNPGVRRRLPTGSPTSPG